MKISYHELASQADYMEAPALDALAQERIRRRVMEKVQRSRRRWRKLALLAAAAVLMISVTAVYYATHDHTKALMAEGPRDGYAQTLEDSALGVIDAYSQDIGLTVEDGGASVTLESVMGFQSQYFSTVYLTFTLTPPEGISFAGVDMSGYSFDGGFLLGTDGKTLGHSGSGSTTLVANEDGTVSMMKMWEIIGALEDTDVTVSLSDFGGINSTQYLSVPGQWDFAFRLQLTQADAVSVDTALFEEAPVTVTEYALSPFGGTLTLTGYEDLMNAKYRAMVQESFGDLPVDWDTLAFDDGQIEQCYAEGLLTEEELQTIYGYYSGSVKAFGDKTISFAVSLEFADGSTYQANTEIGDYPLSRLDREDSAETENLTDQALLELAAGNQEEDADVLMFLFDAPQDLTDAEYLVVEGVKIPLG